jgi:BON domain
MPRSNRRQRRTFGRHDNPQSYERGSGGFEQTGTGYRYDDQRRFGSQQHRGEFGRNWPGQEDWRESERPPYFEGRFGQESRFGRGGYEGNRGMGQQSWSSQGYPESYRDWSQSRRENDWNREQESRYGRSRGEWRYGPEEYEASEGEYEGYEPGEYSSGVSRFGSSQRFGGYRGSGGEGWSQGSGRFFGQGFQGGFGQGGSRSTEDYQPGSPQYRGASRGSFAGRGPQGYKRSDERITEDINEELTQDPDIDAANIAVEVQNGEVTLKGTVPDRESKRRAEDLAESTSGVKQVQNQLRVRREDESESEGRKEKSDEKQRPHRQQLAS